MLTTRHKKIARILTVIAAQCLLHVHNSSAQTIEISAHQQFSGKSIKMKYQVTHKDQMFLAFGLKYHINNPNDWDSRGHSFKYRMHADKLYNHFGATTSIGCRMYQNEKNNYRFYLNLSADANYLGVQGEQYWITEELTQFNEVVFVEAKTDISPFFSSDINLCTRFEHEISQQIGISAELGFGAIITSSYWEVFVDPTDNSLYYTYAPWGYDWFGEYLAIGLSYNFKNRNTSDP